jgi:hypothetical protein
MGCFNNPRTFIKTHGHELDLDPDYPKEFNNLTGHYLKKNKLMSLIKPM